MGTILPALGSYQVQIQERDAVGALSAAFDEVWRVVKIPANPKSTWQLAGSEQLT